MASLQVRPEDEEQEQLERLGALGPQATGALSRPTRFGGGTGAALPNQRGGSPFVGFDKYVAANQGATQALGQKVEGVVTGAGQTARDALGRATGAYNTA